MNGDRRRFLLNGFDLNDGGNVRVQSTNLFGIAKRTVDSGELARDDGRILLNSGHFAGRTISVAGQVSASSQRECDWLIDWLKRTLTFGQKIELATNFPEGYRIWSGVATNLNISRGSFDVSRAGFSFEMECESPAARSSVGLIDFSAATNISTAASAISVENIGTYRTKPTIIISSSSSSSSSTEITLGNPDSSEYLTFNANLKAGDVITVDCEAKTIIHNSMQLRASGTFPCWEYGAGMLEYQDNLAARNHQLRAVYNPKYI